MEGKGHSLESGLLLLKGVISIQLKTCYVSNGYMTWSLILAVDYAQLLHDVLTERY